MAPKKKTTSKKKTSTKPEKDIKEYIGKNGRKDNCKCGSKSSCGGCGYFLGFIGAAVYYIGAAPTFWAAVLGFLKAIVWPAFLIFELLKFLGA